MLTPLQVGNFKLKNRLVMPGMTRCRSNPVTGVPGDLVKEYFVQRAESAALIITESMPVNAHCNPWPGSSAVWNEDSIPVWKGIIDAIHKKTPTYSPSYSMVDVWCIPTWLVVASLCPLRLSSLVERHMSQAVKSPTRLQKP